MGTLLSGMLTPLKYILLELRLVLENVLPITLQTRTINLSSEIPSYLEFLSQSPMSFFIPLGVATRGVCSMPDSQTFHGWLASFCFVFLFSPMRKTPFFFEAKDLHLLKVLYYRNPSDHFRGEEIGQLRSRRVLI